MPIVDDIGRNKLRVNDFCSVTMAQLKGGQIWGDSKGLEDLGKV